MSLVISGTMNGNSQYLSELSIHPDLYYTNLGYRLELNVPASQVPFLTVEDGWRSQPAVNQAGNVFVDKTGLSVTGDDTSGAAEKPSAAEAGPSIWATSRLPAAIVPWSHELIFAWNWVWMDLKGLFPGLHCHRNRPSSQAMGASLTLLGIATLARARRPDLLSSSEWLHRWAIERVETAVETEPGATATVIALYGLAVSEVWNCSWCLLNLYN